jgi:hypothetical protein
VQLPAMRHASQLGQKSWRLQLKRMSFYYQKGWLKMKHKLF